jgi:hypothetical protein
MRKQSYSYVLAPSQTLHETKGLVENGYSSSAETMISSMKRVSWFNGYDATLAEYLVAA